MGRRTEQFPNQRGGVITCSKVVEHQQQYPPVVEILLQTSKELILRPFLITQGAAHLVLTTCSEVRTAQGEKTAPSAKASLTLAASWILNRVLPTPGGPRSVSSRNVRAQQV